MGPSSTAGSPAALADGAVPAELVFSGSESVCHIGRGKGIQHPSLSREHATLAVLAAPNASPLVRMTQLGQNASAVLQPGAATFTRIAKGMPAVDLQAGAIIDFTPKSTAALCYQLVAGAGTGPSTEFAPESAPAHIGGATSVLELRVEEDVRVETSAQAEEAEETVVAPEPAAVVGPPDYRMRLPEGSNSAAATSAEPALGVAQASSGPACSMGSSQLPIELGDSQPRRNSEPIDLSDDDEEEEVVVDEPSEVAGGGGERCGEEHGCEEKRGSGARGESAAGLLDQPEDGRRVKRQRLEAADAREAAEVVMVDSGDDEEENEPPGENSTRGAEAGGEAGGGSVVIDLLVDDEAHGEGGAGSSGVGGSSGGGSSSSDAPIDLSGDDMSVARLLTKQIAQPDNDVSFTALSERRRLRQERRQQSRAAAEADVRRVHSPHTPRASMPRPSTPSTPHAHRRPAPRLALVRITLP